MKISSSFLNKEKKDLEIIKKIDKSSSDFIHVDVMDGKFVTNKTESLPKIKKIFENTKKPLDVHLMVKNPIKYINELSLLNIEYISFHYEAVLNKVELIKFIKNRGFKVGMSINPNTSVSLILPFLDDLDLVLIMSVEPGESGQSFNKNILYKLDSLRKIIDERKLSTVIEVDGGINDRNIKLLKEKKVDIVVVASYIQSGEMEEKIQLLKNK